MDLSAINRLKKKYGLSNPELAKRSGFTLSTVDKITSGINENPKIETLAALARAIGVPLGELLPPEVLGSGGFSPEAMALARSFDALDEYGCAALRQLAEIELRRVQQYDELLAAEPDYPERDIPLYTEAAAAGFASPQVGQDFEYYTLKRGDPPGAAYAVYLQGDSMEPWFPNGSMVFVSHDPVEEGDVGIFCINGGTVCKQFHRDSELGMTYLFSLNRARRDADLVIGDESGSLLICQGRVITPYHFPIPGIDY